MRKRSSPSTTMLIRPSGCRSLRVMRAVRPHLGLVERGSGVLLIGMGVLLFTERLTLITAWLTRMFGNGLAL